MAKNPPANAGDVRRKFDPCVGKTPGRRAGQPTPVFLPGEPHGQRSLEGCSPRGRTESDTTEATKFADQGWNLSLLQQNLSPNRWATRQVSQNVHFKCLTS